VKNSGGLGHGDTGPPDCRTRKEFSGGGFTPDILNRPRAVVDSFLGG